MTEPGLMSQWAVCGIAAAAARFVPVPLLDDVVRQRAAQVAVLRTVRAHGGTQPSDLLQPLWGEPERGGGARLRRRLRKVGRRLLLFPVRKYTALFGAVRGVPTDVLRVVLLARSVERSLERGGLRTGDDARALRRAVDEAMAGVDLRMLLAALGDGLSQSRGLGASAVAFARRRFTTADPEAGLDPDAQVSESAERVTEVLRRPEIRQLLDRFDAQVDARLAPAQA